MGFWRRSLRATAIIERFFLSLKDEWLRRICIPLRRDAMRREISSYICWFAEERPHQGLGGRTPKEAYEGVSARNGTTTEKQEPHAIPHSELVVRFHEGRKQLPIVELERAA